MSNKKIIETKKIIEIEHCDECNRWNEDRWQCSSKGWTNDDHALEIPEWCPLPDSKKSA